MGLSEIANLATAISAALATFGLFLLAYQVYLQRKEQRNQSITQLLEIMITPEFRRKLAFIYSMKPDNLCFDKLTESQIDIVTEISARFEELGQKVHLGTVPKKEAIKIFYDWVIPCAQQLRLNILDQRQKRGPSYRYREQFDMLAKECKRYQLKQDGRKHNLKHINLEELLKIDPMPIVMIGSNQKSIIDSTKHKNLRRKSE